MERLMPTTWFEEFDDLYQQHLQRALKATMLIAQRKGIGANRFTSQQAIVSELVRARAGREVCHVLGSGTSALGSISSINPNEESIFHCNYSGFTGLPSDFYLLECASCRTDILLPGTAPLSVQSDVHLDLLNRIENRSGLIVCKNIWEQNKVTSRILEDKYKNVKLVVDTLLPFYEDLHRLRLYKLIYLKVLESSATSLVQYLTTVNTLITYAYLAGYREIYVHGLDGQGPSFVHQWHAYPDLYKRLYPSGPPAIYRNQRHPCGYPARILLVHFQEVLRAQNVTLSHAVHRESRPSKMSEFGFSKVSNVSDLRTAIRRSLTS